MTRELQRNGQVISLAAAIAQTVARGDVASGLEQLTSEAWAARDAEVAARRAAERAAEECRQIGRKREALAEAGFPLRAIEYAISADESNLAIARIRAWDPKRENVLVLSGSKGIGKTVAATWWALRWAVQRDSAPAFARAATFAASSRYDRDSDGRERWLRAAALVFDDMGAEFADAKGSLLVDLDELIDVFYGDRKPLLITTNCPHTAFAARYGERIVDRIRECGVFFEWSGPSLRGRSAS